MSKKFVLLLFISFAVLCQDVESSHAGSSYLNRFRKIIVTSPNGGESWCVDSTYNITWRSKGWIAFVKIEYSTDNDSTWETLTSRTRNDGSFSWRVPDAPSDLCLVRVSALYGWVSDVSDEVFSIVPDSSAPDSSYINVVAPSGGDVWYSDTFNYIEWNSYNTSGMLRIEYTIDAYFDSTGGDSLPNWITITDSTEDNGSFEWFTPADISSDSCMVRITDIDGDPSDLSGIFSIIPHDTVAEPYISITSPNGGEVWYADTFNYIEWNSYGTSGMLKIEYMTGSDSVENWITITDSAADNGSFDWFTPAGISSENCMIRITDVDGSPTDVSDDVFSILPQDTVYIDITSPNGGEVWYADTFNYIEWNSYGTSGLLKIEYTTDAYFDSVGGDSVINWVTITDSAADNGSFEWFIPFGISSDECMVRITDTDGSPSDVSDDVFSINPMPYYISITSPNGGEVWYADTFNYIEWNSYGTSGMLKIEYTIGGDSVENWITITDSAADNGSFEWFTPAGIYSDECVVRITDIDGSPTDMSNNVFSILPQDTVYISITSPNGGEVWYADTVNYIEWNSNGTSGMLKLEYTLDAYYGSTEGDSVTDWVTITDSAEDNGSFEWYTPSGVSSDECMVRITDTDGSPSDMSDDVFSIISLDSVSVSSVESIELPKVYALNVKGIIPSSKLTVNYALPKKASLKLNVYDISGKKIVEISEDKPAGFYSRALDLASSPNGVYFVRIQANGNEFIATRKTVLMCR